MKVRKYNNGGPIKGEKLISSEITDSKPRNVRVESTTTNKTSQKDKTKKSGKSKSKVKVDFRENVKVKNLDTGESTEKKTKQVDKSRTKRSGEVKNKQRVKSTFKIKDKDDKLLVKQVDKKSGSRVRVTKKGKAKYVK